MDEQSLTISSFRGARSIARLTHDQPIAADHGRAVSAFPTTSDSPLPSFHRLNEVSAIVCWMSQPGSCVDTQVPQTCRPSFTPRKYDMPTTVSKPPRTSAKQYPRHESWCISAVRCNITAAATDPWEIYLGNSARSGGFSHQQPQLSVPALDANMNPWGNVQRGLDRREPWDGGCPPLRAGC